TPPPPRPTLFPYTTLFRSGRDSPGPGDGGDSPPGDAGVHTVRAPGRPLPGADRRQPRGPAAPSHAPSDDRVELRPADRIGARSRSEEHTSELQSQSNLVCR